MTEKEAFALIGQVLAAGFVLAGYNTTDPANSAYVDIRQSEQPIITGRPAGKAVLVDSLYSKRYGWLERKDLWDQGQNKMVHSEAQLMESTYQVGALAPQDPTAADFATSPTAFDLVYRASAILQSSVSLRTLRAAGVGILRITDIRQPEMAENDQDKFEQTPSFDFTFSYKNTDISEEATITKFDLEIDRV